MQRSAFACWTILALFLGTAFGGGARLVCVSPASDACGTAVVDGCCGEPVEREFPTTPEGQDCCIDVLPPTAAETVVLRAHGPRNDASSAIDALPHAILAIPPPFLAEATPRSRPPSGIGPPADVIAIVRTSRLLL